MCAALAWYAANSPAGLGMLWCGAFAVARAFGGLGVAVFAGGVTLVGTGVHATDIEPGLVGGSEFSEVRFAGDTDRAAAVYAGTDPLTPDDIADTVSWILSRPARVNINTVELMPTCQAPGPLAIRRRAE